MSSLVKSVEFVELELTGTTVSGALTKNQDISKCVPFMSHYCGSTYLSVQFIDYWFTDDGTSYINAKRQESGLTSYIKGYVVEFDSDKVKVYQGELPTTITYAGETPITVTTSGTSFVQNNTAMIFYNSAYNTTNTQYYNQYLVRGIVNSDGTTISFRKMVNVANNHCGHYYLFESIAGDFTVTHIVGSFSSGSATSVGVYDWHNTFLIASYCGEYDGYNSTYASMRAYLWGDSEVHFNKESSSYTNYHSIQKIEFSNDATSSGTRYCPKITSYHSMSTSTLTRTLGFDGNVYDSDTLTIINVQNPTRGAATIGASIPSTFHAVYLVNSNTGYCIQRANDSSYARPTYYLVDWAGQAPLYPNTGTSPGTTVSGTCPVKSVENITTTVYEHVKVEQLSKGQDVSNCVVFRSGYSNNTSNYGEQYRQESLTYFRGNELYFERGNEGWDYLTQASVVEFFPDQVRVQQGRFCIDVDSDFTTVTLDISVDPSKTFLYFGCYLSDSVDEWGYHTCRGYISSNIELIFERGVSYRYPIMGAYYIVEDLQNWWNVEHYNSSSFNSTVYINYFKDLLSERNAFAIISTLVQSANDDPYYACWRTYYHGPLDFRVDRQVSGNNSKVSLQVVKFTDRTKTRVHYRHVTLSDSTTSYTYSLYDGFQGKLVSPIFSNLASVGRVDTSSINGNTGAFMFAEYNEETNEVTVSRNVSSSTYHATMNSVYSVCWDGYYESQPEDVVYVKHNSFIKTIEKFSYVGTSGRVFFNMTKNQNPANCLPIGTWLLAEYSDDVERFFPTIWFDLNTPRELRLEFFWSPDDSDNNINIELIEFDPEQVRVQSGTTWLWPGEYTKTVSIDTVDISKAFIIHYPYPSDQLSDLFGASFVINKFNSTTQIEFSRGYSTGNDYILINWYLVECLQDQWEVHHSGDIVGNYTSYTYDFPTVLPTTRILPITSYSFTSSSDDPYYIYFRVYLNIDHRGYYSVTANRQISGVPATVRHSVVVFNESYGIRSEQISFYFASAEASIVVDLGREYNVNSTVIWGGTSCPTMRINSSNSSHHQSAYYSAIFQDSRTLLITRSSNATPPEAWGRLYLVEFPMVTHSVSGVVTEKGKPVNRKLNLHRTDTGEVLAHTTSSGAAGYCLYTTYSGSTYVVCLDDPGGSVYNGLIETDIYPEVVDGTFPYEEGWVQ